jgi:cytochrome P450
MVDSGVAAAPRGCFGFGGVNVTNVMDPAPEFDLYGPAVIADPYPTYAAMRETGALVQVAGTWIVTRYELADQVLKNSSFGRGEYPNLIKSALGPGPLAESFSRWMLYLDPPDHTRLRTLVMSAFTPRAVDRLREVIQTTVERLIAEMEKGDTADFLVEFAYPLPVHVICELLGVPNEDREEFKTWSADLGRGLQITNLNPEVVARGNAAAAGFNDYFTELFAARRETPGDGFLDALLAAEHEGAKLTDDELLATVVLLFFGGHETTVNLLGNGMTALLRERSAWDELCADPALARAAVAEMLRIDTPVQRASRIALEDVELEGQRIKTGEMIVVLLGGANRDERRFEDPDRFSLHRTGPNLSFAAGPHYCVGATLARVEAEIAVASLARRLPDMRIDSGSLEYRPNVILRGLQSLPVRFSTQ